MKMKVKLDKGAFAPESAHKADAGYDIRTPINFVVHAGESAIVDTGVHVAIPEGYVGFLSGYTGSIVVKLYNNEAWNPLLAHTVRFERGDKIIQLVILPIAKPDIELADSLEETERGDGGFGSTGR